MKVTLEYTAQLRRAAGVRRQELEVPEASRISAVLRHAALLHGQEFERVVFTREGKLQSALLVFCGERQVHLADDPVLESGAAVTVMSPISGG